MSMSNESEESKNVPTASFYFKLASDLSSRFVNVAPEKLNEEIREALRQIIDFFDADCCTIFQAIGSEDRIELVQAVGAGSAASPCSGSDWQELLPLLFRDVLHNKENVCLRTQDDHLPAAARKYRARLARLRMDSLLLASISTGTPAITYLFMVASTRNRRMWSKLHVSQLRLLAEILVNAISRRGMQEALQRTTRDLSEAKRICHLGSWEWNLESGRIVEMEGVDRVLGVKPESQASFMEFVHDSDRDQVQKAIDRAFAKEADSAPIEYRMRSRRGDIRIVRSQFEVVHSENSPHMVGTLHDVTNARRGEQELQLLRAQHWHENRVIRTGVLVASLAHELSQPLAAILSNAQAGLRFLAQEPLDRQEICEILKDVVADNRRAREIIDVLRAMIRREKTRRVRVDATDIVHDVLTLLHSEFVTQKVEVELACDNPCFVLADKTQIEQVLLNLILNSIESMQNQPVQERSLQVKVNHIGQGEIQISVRDSGIGIPKDQLNSVFEAFWTTKAHGLGMGLAICRSIIEAHGGRIWTECNSDRGVIFLFRLPAA